jgi:phytanoyl-CoA hydroxylase
MTSFLKQTFAQRGYIIVENIINPHPLQADYAALLDRVVGQAVAAGWLDDTYADLPFAQRWTTVLQRATHNLYPFFDISLPNGNITEDNPVHLSRAVYDLIRTPKLLDVIEALIGSEILANPIQHVRIKPPQQAIPTDNKHGTLVQTTGWHQDQGVCREEADATDMITVWVAVTDATINNGCLQVIPYSHLAGLADHCPLNVSVEIPSDHLAGQPVPVPLKAGSVLLMHRLMQHASLPNQSDSIRWSFDLRYQPIGQPTGRDELPGLVARSASHPTTRYDDWVASWTAARQTLAARTERGKLHRWDPNAITCA